MVTNINIRKALLIINLVPDYLRLILVLKYIYNGMLNGISFLKFLKLAQYNM